MIAAPGSSLEILPKIDATADENDETIRARLVTMLDVALGLKLGDGQALTMARQKETLLDILIQDAVLCQGLGQGFVDYYWPKPGAGYPAPI